MFDYDAHSLCKAASSFPEYNASFLHNKIIAALKFLSACLKEHFLDVLANMA